MREIRTFELDRQDAPTRWVIDRPQTLHVLHGQIWLTIEGEDADHWLDAGASVELKAYSTIWVSGAQDAIRFSLASASTKRTPTIGTMLRTWFTRRTAPARIARYQT
jgi:quercetin dioxygenase-like cupin family protein